MADADRRLAQTLAAAGLSLAARRDWREVALSDIAAEAGVALEQLYGPFSSKDAIEAAIEADLDRLAAEAEDEPPGFDDWTGERVGEPIGEPTGERIDETDRNPPKPDGSTVHADSEGDDASDEPSQEGSDPIRLAVFDTAMRRLEAMQEARAGLVSIHRARRASLAGRLRASAYALRTARWILEASGVSTSGERGAARALVFARIWARAVRRWEREEGPALNLTMAGLDRDLRDAEETIRTWRKRLTRRRKASRTDRPDPEPATP